MTSHLISWIVFTPLIGMIAVLVLPRRLVQALSLATTAAALALASLLWFKEFRHDGAAYQLVERVDWIRAIRAEYFVGIDGLSLVLVWLTTFLFFIAVLASGSVERAEKAGGALLLLLEVAVLGAFVSLDFFLFFVFWELALLPIFFLIGVWGGPRRERAAMKFLVASLAGSALMLVAMIALRLDAGTFSIPTLVELARAGRLVGANLPGGGALLGMSFTTWCFSFLLIGFAIRLPIVPLHGWLVDAQVAARTPLAMLLPAIVVKLGAFGLLRACFPIFPELLTQSAFALGVLGVISILYGACVAAGQKDFERVVVHFSISQIGFVLLGLAAMTEWGMTGAAVQVFQHGTSIAALILVVGVVCESTAHGELVGFGGLRHSSPRLFLLCGVACLTAIAVTGLSSFVIPFYSPDAFRATDPRSRSLAIVAGIGILVGAGALIRAFVRVFFGPRSPRSAERPEPNVRAMACASILLALALAVGVVPSLIQGPIGSSVTRLVQTIRAP